MGGKKKTDAGSIEPRTWCRVWHERSEKRKVKTSTGECVLTPHALVVITFPWCWGWMDSQVMIPMSTSACSTQMRAWQTLRRLPHIVSSPDLSGSLGALCHVIECEWLEERVRQNWLMWQTGKSNVLRSKCRSMTQDQCVVACNGFSTSASAVRSTGCTWWGVLFLPMPCVCLCCLSPQQDTHCKLVITW